MAQSNPLYLITAWFDAKGKVIFSEETMLTRIEFERYHTFKYRFIGKVATVIVGSDEPDLSRMECEWSAIAFMTGNYVRIDFDLDRCDVKWSQGVSRIVHPH